MIVESIAGKSLSSLKNDEFKEKTFLKKQVLGGVKLDKLIPEFFFSEGGEEVLGERHFDVQLAGGVILHQGKIAEMKTGEGKTLVSTLPAYLNSLSGKGFMWLLSMIIWLGTLNGWEKFLFFKDYWMCNLKHRN